MVQLMGKTVGHVFEELDIVYRQHPEVQNDKHFHTALALLQGIQCMTWELENEEWVKVWRTNTRPYFST